MPSILRPTPSLQKLQRKTRHRHILRLANPMVPRRAVNPNIRSPKNGPPPPHQLPTKYCLPIHHMVL